MKIPTLPALPPQIKHRATSVITTYQVADERWPVLSESEFVTSNNTPWKKTCCKAWDRPKPPAAEACLNVVMNFNIWNDHLSYVLNLSSWEKKIWKKNQVWTGFEPLEICNTGAMLYQLNTKPTGSWSLCEFVYPQKAKMWSEYVC